MKVVQDRVFPTLLKDRNYCNIFPDGNRSIWYETNFCSVAKIIPHVAKITGAISISMAGFDLLSWGIGLFDSNNPLVVLNQNLHSNALYNAFQIGVTAVAAFTTGFSIGQKTAVCFVAGTMILTASGVIAIEKIKAGDKVISTNPETKETSEKPVIETYVRRSNLLIHLWIGGKETLVTSGHPYWIPEKGWVNAGELVAGDQLMTPSEELIMIQKVQHQRLNDPVTVYNFQVEGFHTYYAGAISVLVHNANNYGGMGDANIADLKRLPKSKIKELGGEGYTQGLKKDGGKSNADLYWDRDGNVYSVLKKGGPPQFVDRIPRD